MLRRFLPVFVIVWLQAAPTWAPDPSRHITQYAHTAWRIEDGTFNSAPWTIVQTPEGYMWVGTADGVLQFDGVRFVRWTPGHGQRLPSSYLNRLATTRDGSVWMISAVGFLSQWKGHTLTSYAAGSGATLAEDNDGTVRLGQNSAPRGTSPLCQVRDTDLRCLGPGDGVPSFKSQHVAGGSRRDALGRRQHPAPALGTWSADGLPAARAGGEQGNRRDFGFGAVAGRAEC